MRSMVLCQASQSPIPPSLLQPIILNIFLPVPLSSSPVCGMCVRARAPLLLTVAAGLLLMVAAGLLLMVAAGRARASMVTSLTIGITITSRTKSAHDRRSSTTRLSPTSRYRRAISS